MDLIEDAGSSNICPSRSDCPSERDNQTAPAAEDRRTALLEDLFGTFEGGRVEPPFRCDYGDNIHAEAEFDANFECVLLDVCLISIGRNCLLGPGVHVYTASHPREPAERAEGVEYGEAVTIGDDVWIGGRAVLILLAITT